MLPMCTVHKKKITERQPLNTALLDAPNITINAHFICDQEEKKEMTTLQAEDCVDLKQWAQIDTAGCASSTLSTDSYSFPKE